MAVTTTREAIRVLPPGVAARIAAGEVIERPASVVKELVENALDAGARRIEVELIAGGVERIRVRDDGYGIPPEQLADAFERHATSKLRSQHDLDTVQTLGFRGEALAAIVAAADVDCTSRVPGADGAAVARFRDGRPAGAGSAAAAPGTTVDVRELFSALPARRRFLRSARGEARAVAEVLTDYALARPEIAFRLLHDGRTSLSTPGSGDRREAAAAIYGADVARSLLEVDAAKEVEAVDGIGGDEWAAVSARVHGLISPPERHRGNRRAIHLFANGRAITSRALVHAVESAYAGALPAGRHPLAVIEIEVPPPRVDVNIHPRKAEVRFRDERLVYSTVVAAIGAALTGAAPPWLEPSLRSATGIGAAPSRDADTPSASEPRATAEPTSPWSGLGREAIAAAGTSPSRPSSGVAPPVHAETPASRQGSLELQERLPPLRPLGQFDETYLVAEAPDGLVLIDQHAAHERVLYEQALAAAGRATPQAQALLESMVASLSPSHAALVDEEQAALAAMGFELEPLDGGAMLIRALPAGLTAREPERALVDYLDRLDAEERLSGPDRAAATLACRAAVMAGDRLSDRQQRELLEALERCERPQTCPHGRPTALHLTNAELQRSFGRTSGRLRASRP